MLVQERSFEIIDNDDLVRLTEFAHADRERFFAKHTDWRKLYEDRLVCIALCQGAAQHFVDGTNGVKDFDVWTFFRANPIKALFARRRACADFGESKFGKHPDDNGYVGRRVDLLMRSFDSAEATPKGFIVDYFSRCKTESARLLSMKAVVILSPDDWFGKVVWNPAE